jgi:5-hydroxyisourate hydrolase-like protein (transthyretin family)
VRFTAGLPGKPSLSVEPPRGRAGQALQLTVEVWDESHRNPLSGAEVRWDARGSSEALTLAPSRTDAQGRATVSLTPARSGNVTFVAKVRGESSQEVSGSINVGIDSGPPQEVRLGLESGAATLRADGADRARLVLRLLDAQGNPVRGQTVRWEGAATGDTLEPESDTTDETGRIRATFTAREAGRRTVRAQVAGTSLEAALTLTAEAPAPPAPAVAPPSTEAPAPTVAPSPTPTPPPETPVTPAP